jgi:hypothetical protein
MANKVSVHIDNAAVRKLGNRRGGPVMSDMERRRRNVTRKARSLAPPGMRPYIKGGVIVRSGKQVLTVDNTHPAAIFVIKGTRPHLIKPKRAGGVLAFTVKGTKVFTRVVHHPGNKPNDFMAVALRTAKK